MPIFILTSQVRRSLSDHQGAIADQQKADKLIAMDDESTN